MSAAAVGAPGGPTAQSGRRGGVLERLSDVFVARPALLTLLLLMPPLLWIGVVYIGSLFA